MKRFSLSSIGALSGTLRVLPLVLVAVASGCREPFSDERVEAGYYRLDDINERYLPTIVACGGLVARSGEVVIRRNYRANYSRVYTEVTTGDTITFHADGDFEKIDKYLDLNLRGRWSNRSEEEIQLIRLRIEGNDVLYHDEVGTECDLRETEAYVLRATDN